MLLLLPADPARAVLDIDDRGPVLEAGGFRLRVTNAGILGNAFFDVGLSFDPSFEFPPNSGQELLNHGELWVGALDASGRERVSGGPELEWRPTLDPQDRVRAAGRSRLGSRWLYDDDGDGRVDEEVLNGRDDDGDGEVDEDLGFSADQMMAADYVDDRPEAVSYIYPTRESHVPLGLSVHQEAYAWSAPGFEKFAGLRFTITNHGGTTLRQVYVGLLADLDSRLRNDRAGHLNDRVERQTVSRTIVEGVPNWVTGNGLIPCANPGTVPSSPPSACMTTLVQTPPAVVDGAKGSTLPRAAVVGLDHTTDPLALISPVARYARAPANVSFRYTVFANGRIPGQGGVPSLDLDRYAALAGRGQPAPEIDPADYVVLVSCGPFASLEPGQSLEFHAALVAGERADSLTAAISSAMYLHHGLQLDLKPDDDGPDSTEYNIGRSGRNGHESCIEAPPGVTFVWDPDCTSRYPDDCYFPPSSAVYTHGQCVWTDTDCDFCTGFGGRDTTVRWLDPGQVPPAPGMRLIPRDHAVRIEWDNRPEVLIAGGLFGTSEARILGYRVYRLSDWRGREALMPPPKNWELIAAFGPDTSNGEIPLAKVIDPAVDYERILFGQRLYPVGRYAMTDATALDGFDYFYVVTTVYNPGLRDVHRLKLDLAFESPLTTSFQDRVSPAAAARPDAQRVWVVPNPFRARAAWDRPQVPGDPLTRHVDFMGLPRARSTIKIWTVAGDFVAQIDHDGSDGTGEAAWNLISRNGQDVESGVYLFTVDSPLGHATGKFVIVR